MTTTNKLHIDAPDLARLKDRVSDLSALDLPKLEVVGRTADDTIDRLLGRSRAPVWPWIATGIGLIAILGAIATYLWMRRPLTDADATASTDDSATGGDAYDDLDAAVGRDLPVAIGEA